MKSPVILSLVGIAAIMLVIGMALASVAFPTIKTQTVTERESTTAVTSDTFDFTISELLISTSTLTRYVTNTSISNLTQTSTAFLVVDVTTLPKTPFNVTAYLAAGTTFGGCYENSNPVPCFTTDLSQAEVFNCLTTAATQSGCSIQVASPPNLGVGSTKTSYSITILYPYVNATQDEPKWANCKFSVLGSSTLPYGYCITISPTAFLVSEAGTPPL